MLTTRVWMGTILVFLTVGMLVIDQRLAPWFPFLFVFIVGLALAACKELIGLLGSARPVQAPLLYGGLILLGTSNWWVHLPGSYGFDVGPWDLILGIWVSLFLVVFLWEMATFAPQDADRGPEGGAIERMARTMWALAYLGLLPCFLAQLRWLYPENQPEHGTSALALVIFVPKACDIGAYCSGRVFGRHPMTPVLSPRKTWEGAVGGVLLGAMTSIGIDRLGPVALLGKRLGLEVGFGMALGIAGMLGDLGESLLKRACRRKDASAVLPGFGGVLDVVDAVLFAGPVGYLWLKNVV